MMEIAGLTTPLLRFIFIGNENGVITNTILQTLMEKTGRVTLDSMWEQHMAWGLGLFLSP
jgi:hypothetical protein